jgi:hypothetical protein
MGAPIGAGAQTAGPSAQPDPPEWADPFCSASDQLIYWDKAKGHGTSDATKYLLGRLIAPGSSVSEHLILFTDTDAYDVTVDRQSLAGTDYLRSSGRFLIELPKELLVKYAYVDSYKLDGADEVYCPTEAHTFGKGTDNLPAPELQNLTTYVATYKQPLPALPCGKTYVPATVKHVVSPTGFQTNTRRVAQIAVFVNSDGDIAKSYVYRSSGVDYGDMRAVFAATHSQYVPATFLCTPIVGEYLFTVDYMP